MKRHIGSVRVEHPVFLAPMAKYTHLPFRLLCHEYGAGLTTTELVSCKSIVRQSPKALDFIRTVPAEKPVALQLFGNNPVEFARAVQMVGDPFDLIDINCGCSVPKAISGEYGAFLLQKPEKIGAIVSAIKKVTDRPVTIKTRIGWKEGDDSVLAVARLAEDAGAEAIALHGRTVTQGFSGSADWRAIAKLKRSTNLIVIGNGDVRAPADVQRMMDETGCDFVQIGRAAIGNANVFRQANQWLETGAFDPRSNADILLETQRFLELCEAYPVPFHEIRSQVMYITRGLPGANRYRDHLAKVHAPAELVQIVASFFESAKANS